MGEKMHTETGAAPVERPADRDYEPPTITSLGNVAAVTLLTAP